MKERMFMKVRVRGLRKEVNGSCERPVLYLAKKRVIHLIWIYEINYDTFGFFWIHIESNLFMQSEAFVK